MATAANNEKFRMNGSPFLSRVPASADGDHHLTGPALARISRLASICDARRGCRGWCGSCPADGSVSVRKIVIEVVLQRRDPLEAHPIVFLKRSIFASGAREIATKLTSR